MQSNIPDEVLQFKFWTDPLNIQLVSYTTTITKLNTLAILSTEIITKETLNKNQFKLNTKTQEIQNLNSIVNNHKKISKNQAIEIQNYYAKIYRNTIYPMEII